MNVNQLSKDIFEQNKEMGWWDDMDRCILQCLMLVVTELAEACEGDRKGLMDDHLPQRKMFEVELADAAIRMMDLGGRYNLNFIDCSETYLESKKWVKENNAAKLLWITHAVVSMGDVAMTVSRLDSETFIDSVSYHYSKVLSLIIATSKDQGLDLSGAVIEKLEYNKNREDHKRENRALDGGKRY